MWSEMDDSYVNQRWMAGYWWGLYQVVIVGDDDDDDHDTYK